MLNKALLMPPILFKISIGNQSHCSIKLSKNFAMSGELITVTVNPDIGYDNTIVGISTNDTVTKVNNTTFTFIMPSENVIVSASSSLLSFRINVNKQGSGTVNVKSIANYGEIVTISFYPSEDYKFGSISISGVSLSGSGNSRTFVMPAHDITINVVFSEIYPGFTPCVIKIAYRNRTSGIWAGFSSQNLLKSDSSLTPQIVNNLCAGHEKDPSSESTLPFKNVFDRPVYINGVLYDNSKSPKLQHNALRDLNGQTLKCYVKNS